MTISAALVKELRERTGAGMMECKNALQATKGDLSAAIELLRVSGHKAAAKRAGKVAAEGTVAISVDNSQRNACLVEVNCETDFVGRSKDFIAFAQQVADCGLQARASSLEELLQLPYNKNGFTIEQARQELIAKVGENIQIRRMTVLQSDVLVGSYIHSNRIGVLVAINRNEPSLARDIAMHIAATNPQAVEAAGVSADIINKEREIFIAQSKETGKPDHIIEKMVSGRITKFLKEICLVDQAFVKNPDQTIDSLLKSHQAQVTAFVRFEVGEGIEKEAHDFASEVKAQLKD